LQGEVLKCSFNISLDLKKPDFSLFGVSTKTMVVETEEIDPAQKNVYFL
jgi:hypothetical protein